MGRKMSRDRRMVAIIAGSLAAISGILPLISRALKIPKVIPLIAVVVAEVLLVISMFVVGRRGCGSNAKNLATSKRETQR